MAEQHQKQATLSPEPTVAHFNTVAEVVSNRADSYNMKMIADVVGLVGQEVQDKDGKRFILASVYKLRKDTLLVSVGDGAMTAGQLLATPHMAALLHLSLQYKSGRYTMIPVDPTHSATVKQIFTAIAAECKLPCMSGSRCLLTCYI